MVRQVFMPIRGYFTVPARSHQYNRTETSKPGASISEYTMPPRPTVVSWTTGWSTKLAAVCRGYMLAHVGLSVTGGFEVEELSTLLNHEVD